jgi:hypothetical protein
MRLTFGTQVLLPSIGGSGLNRLKELAELAPHEGAGSGENPKLA